MIEKEISVIKEKRSEYDQIGVETRKNRRAWNWQVYVSQERKHW